MKNKLIALIAVVIVFISLSSLKIKVPAPLPKLKKAITVPDWSTDTTISPEYKKYLNHLYESSNH